MTDGPSHSWRSVQTAILDRIHDGTWLPGDRIPGEQALAEEFGCSRTTMNRALRALAEDGVVERRRRAGTRVSSAPVRQARLAIPLVRDEVEAQGAAYGYRLLKRETRRAPQRVAARLGLAAEVRLMRLVSLHLADDRPHMVERRWVHIGAVPSVVEAPLERVSANEWLVREVPFSSGEIAFGAGAASREEAAGLGVDPGAPVFIIERTTWMKSTPITTVRMAYPADHRMEARL